MRLRVSLLFRLLRIAAVSLLFPTTLLACKMTNDLPRNESLPLFDPHRPVFTCEAEVTKVPPVDAQADDWFLEARALEDPNTWEEDRDYSKIVQLTRLAAERRHWKAMLNLASLYIEGRDPKYGANEAVRIVEDAMRLGIPAAFDRMGTYYLNSTGVPGDSTKAYAFFQKAADMGNPDSMVFLAEKIRAVWDNPAEGFWANKAIAIKMFECAFGQGQGMAAYYLSPEYNRFLPSQTPATKLRALKVLHEGVKLGCALCADRLSIEFGAPFDLAKMLPPHIDKARGERYEELGAALSFNPSLRFPNLDKVLPLPPADLPPWNGEKETLVNAAMAVKLAPTVPKQSKASIRTGRYFLDAAYKLRESGQNAKDLSAPFSGYWQPTAPGQSEAVRAALAKIPPGLYQVGEPFARVPLPNGQNGAFITEIVWVHLITLRHDHPAVDPRATQGVTRAIANLQPLASTTGGVAEATGTWQPWVSGDHPLSGAVNQPWRQIWLSKGQSFPVPEVDWMLGLPREYLTWYLLDATGVDIG